MPVLPQSGRVDVGRAQHSQLAAEVAGYGADELCLAQAMVACTRKASATCSRNKQCKERSTKKFTTTATIVYIGRAAPSGDPGPGHGPWPGMA